MEALVKTAVDTAVLALTTTFEAKLKTFADEKEEFKKSLETLETKNTRLEEDLLRIPVGSSGSNGYEARGTAMVTDSMVRKQHGYGR